MKTPDEIDADLTALVEQHYYAEPHELKWAVKSYEESLGMGERDLLRKHAVERLTVDRSIVNVVLVSCWHLPEAVPVLSAMLDDLSTSSQLSRSLMSVLEHYADERACRAVERFLDSEQEGDALTSLARMDYIRAIPGLKRAMKKDHLADVCLHVFYERRKTMTPQDFLGELSEHIVGDSRFFLERLHATLKAKAGDYNPFEPGEIENILVYLQQHVDDKR